MPEKATVNIPDDVLLPILQSQVQAGIVAALGSPEDLITKVVENHLKSKVGSDGKKSRYSYDDKHDLIEVMSRACIQKAVRQALQDWVDEKRPAIEEQVKKGLRRKEGVFARAMVDGLVTAIKQSWSFNCEITLGKD